jgi:hypothetical protein
VRGGRKKMIRTACRSVVYVDISFVFFFVFLALTVTFIDQTSALLLSAAATHYLHTFHVHLHLLLSAQHLISSNRSHLISRGFLSLVVSCICARSIHYRPASSSPSFHTKSHKCAWRIKSSTCCLKEATIAPRRIRSSS